MRNTSIRYSILFKVLIVFVIGTISIAVIVPQMIFDHQLKTIKPFLYAESLILSNSLAQSWKELSIDDFPNIADNYQAQLGYDVYILDSTGQVLGTSDTSDQITNYYYQEEIQQAILSGKGNILERNINLKAPVLHIARTITIQDEIVGFVRIDYPTQVLMLSTRRVLWEIWGIYLLLFAVVGVIVWISSRNVAANLLILVKQIKNKTAANNEEMVAIESNNEIELVKQFTQRLLEHASFQSSMLKEERDNLEAILAQINDGVIVVNSEGKIIMANPSALNLFSITELSEQNNLVRVIRYHQLFELWNKYQETKEEQATLLDLPDLNKSIQVLLTPLKETQSENAIIIFQDLTRLHRLETIRRDFISNISHELRTPLASLKALSETIQISALDDPEATHHFLTKMDIEIEALAQMVSELLELSRIESGQVPLQLTKVNPKTILDTACKRMEAQAHLSEIKITINHPNENAYFLADSSRFEQVLVNIIQNAIKFTPTHGKIDCGLEYTEGEVIFIIKDNGIGISKEDLPRIFERFYKSKQPIKGSGTGLGLSIAKHLVEAHQGRIWVESIITEGSTFYISIPRLKNL